MSTEDQAGSEKRYAGNAFHQIPLLHAVTTRISKLSNNVQALFVKNLRIILDRLAAVREYAHAFRHPMGKPHSSRCNMRAAILIFLAVVAQAFVASFSHAYSAVIETSVPAASVKNTPVRDTKYFYSSAKSVKAISIDNDLFAPGGANDRDFTAGMALTYSGVDYLPYWQPLDEWLGRFDAFSVAGTSWSKGYDVDVTPTIEVGSYGFTPSDISSADVVEEDRPYASFVYLSARRVYQSRSYDADSWTTTLTLGALGWDIFSETQNNVHELLGSDKARGWAHQISDGGEFTLRYQVAYHNVWQNDVGPMNLQTSYFASIGYISEMGIALSTRSGLISSSQSRFSPELITFGERVGELSATPFQGREHYFWGGISLKARAYNAFLQGQFRHSDHTFDAGDLNVLLGEAWAGYTLSLSSAFKLSYFLRVQSSEVKEGVADRHQAWGGLVLSHTL